MQELKKFFFSTVKPTFNIWRNWLVLDHFHGIPSGLSLKVSWKVSTNKYFGCENENAKKKEFGWEHSNKVGLN